MSGINRQMSIIRPSLRLRPGRILIGLLTAITAAALIPSAAGAGAPKGDQAPAGHHLVFRLSGRSHQDVIGAHSVTVRARCPVEACTVVASATSQSPAIHTARVHAQIPAGSAAALTVPLAPRDRGKLKAALEAGHSPTLMVKVIAHDGAGNRIPLTIEVRPFKP
jgi:hypothetical protein